MGPRRILDHQQATAFGNFQVRIDVRYLDGVRQRSGGRYRFQATDSVGSMSILEPGIKKSYLSLILLNTNSAHQPI
jgi:hypothetical protein